MISKKKYSLLNIIFPKLSLSKQNIFLQKLSKKKAFWMVREKIAEL